MQRAAPMGPSSFGTLTRAAPPESGRKDTGPPPSANFLKGSTRTYGLRKELVGELNSRVVRWLNKVSRVNSTVSVSSPNFLSGPRTTLLIETTFQDKTYKSWHVLMVRVACRSQRGGDERELDQGRPPSAVLLVGLHYCAVGCARGRAACDGEAASAGGVRENAPVQQGPGSGDAG
eukprot:1119426-Prorocentrum_minimum.AAC.4